MIFALVAGAAFLQQSWNSILRSPKPRLAFAGHIHKFDSLSDLEIDKQYDGDYNEKAPAVHISLKVPRWLKSFTTSQNVVNELNEAVGWKIFGYAVGDQYAIYIPYSDGSPGVGLTPTANILRFVDPWGVKLRNLPIDTASWEADEGGEDYGFDDEASNPFKNPHFFEPQRGYSFDRHPYSNLPGMAGGMAGSVSLRLTEMFVDDDSSPVVNPDDVVSTKSAADRANELIKHIFIPPYKAAFVDNSAPQPGAINQDHLAAGLGFLEAYSDDWDRSKDDLLAIREFDRVKPIPGASDKAQEDYLLAEIALARLKPYPQRDYLLEDVITTGKRINRSISFVALAHLCFIMLARKDPAAERCVCKMMREYGDFKDYEYYKRLQAGWQAPLVDAYSEEPHSPG